MKGILLKKSPEGIWIKRFCETDGVFLTIYRSKSADKIVQIICMPQASNIKLIEFLKHDSDAGYAFDIIMLDGKTVNFKAQSLKEASLWIEALMEMIKMPMPTSLPTTPIDDFLKSEMNKENASDNGSKKRVTFDLSTNPEKKVVVQESNPNPSLIRKVTENYQRQTVIKSPASQQGQTSQKPTNRQQLLSREDLSLKFYFRRDEQMILTHILSLYPASPAYSTAISVPFSGFAIPAKREPVALAAHTSPEKKLVVSKTTSRIWSIYLSLFAIFLISALSVLYIYPKYINQPSSSRQSYFGRNARNIVLPTNINSNQSSSSRTYVDIHESDSGISVNEDISIVEDDTNQGSNNQDTDVDLDHPAFDLDRRTTKSKRSRYANDDDSLTNVHYSERTVIRKGGRSFSLGNVIVKAVQLPFKLVFFALRFVFQRVDIAFIKILS